MIGMIVLLTKGTLNIYVFPNGEARIGTEAGEVYKSQLLAIRTLMLAGWKITEPHEWEEAEV